MPIGLPREMPRQISFTGALNKTTAFLDSICSTKRPTWDSYPARKAWEHSRGSQRSKNHTVGFLNLSFFEQSALISCQTRICNLLYYFQKYPFLSFFALFSLHGPSHYTCICLLLCKHFHTYISDWIFSSLN